MSRVLLLSEQAPSERGGVAVATERIARGLMAQGAVVHVLGWSRRAPPGARTSSDERGLAVHRLGRNADAADALMALTAHARELVSRLELEIIHGIYASSAGYAATVAGACESVPSVVSLRGNDLDRGLFRADHLPFLEHAVRRATCVTAVSRELAHVASRTFDREVTYVPNAVDAERFRPETADNSLRASLELGDAPVLGFVGELREKKGMRFLLPAFARLARRRDARLLLIGGVRADARAALSEFERSAPEAASRLRLVEYDRSPARLSRLMALCDVLLFPSLYEGMPNAVLEAMAAARPILATDVGGHRDLIEHGERGALLSLTDLDRLPEAVEEMLDLPADDRARLGGAARAFVIAAHSLEAERAAYARVHREAHAAFQARPRETHADPSSSS